LRDVNWGWQVVFFRLHALGGLALVQTVHAALLALTMALLVELARRRSGSTLSAMLAGLLAFFGLWQLILIRPQTLSLLLFVLLLAALDAGVAQRRWLFAPPLLMLLWVNVHGGFPIGLVLIGAYFLADLLPFAPGRLRATGAPRSPGPMLACLIGSTVATLGNPYGWGVYEYVLQTTGRASRRRIDEWLPPGLDTLTGVVFFASLFLLGLLIWRSPRRLFRREWCVLACLLPLALGSIRMTAWWFLASTPILAAQISAAWPRMLDSQESEAPTLGAAVTCLALAAVMVLSTPWLEAYNPVLRMPGRAHRTESTLQAVADRLLAIDYRGPLFTRFAWAEYLGWALTPRCTVFMDGRIEIIPDAVWQEYVTLTRGQSGWDAILDKYRVNLLVLDRHTDYHAGLRATLHRQPQPAEWQESFAIGEAEVWQRAPDSREPPGNGEE
jgi:hypothetical protein